MIPEIQEITDSGNAARMVRIMRDRALHVHGKGKDKGFDAVLQFDRTYERWVEDKTGYVLKETRRLSETILQEARDLVSKGCGDRDRIQALIKFAGQSGDEKRRQAAVRLWRAEEGVTITPDDFETLKCEQEQAHLADVASMKVKAQG